MSFCITKMKKLLRAQMCKLCKGSRAIKVWLERSCHVVMRSSCLAQHALLDMLYSLGYILFFLRQKINICIKFPTVLALKKHLAYLLLMSWECVIEYETLYIVLLFRARCTMKTSLTTLRSLRNLSSPDIRVPSSDHLQSLWLSSHH